MRRLLFVLLLLVGAPASAQQPLPAQQCLTTAIASGTGDAIAIPLLPCTATTTFLALTFTAPNATTAPTISENGQTPHTIVNFDGTALSPGFFQNNQTRVLQFTGFVWKVLTGTGGGVPCPPATSTSLGCVQTDNVTTSVTNGIITAAPPNCSDLPGGCFFSIPINVGGLPPDRWLVDISIPQAVTCQAGLPGSTGYAFAAPTIASAVTINQVTGGVITTRGSVSWAGGAHVPTFSSSSGISFAAGDLAQFVFPNLQDATFGDVSITLACTHS